MVYPHVSKHEAIKKRHYRNVATVTEGVHETLVNEKCVYNMISFGGKMYICTEKRKCTFSEVLTVPSAGEWNYNRFFVYISIFYSELILPLY